MKTLLSNCEGEYFGKVSTFKKKKRFLKKARSYASSDENLAEVHVVFMKKLSKKECAAANVEDGHHVICDKLVPGSQKFFMTTTYFK